MKHLDLILTLHNSSKIYILNRIESEKHKEQFRNSWIEIQHIIKYSENQTQFLAKMMSFQAHVDFQASKKWWPTLPKYENIAIDNAIDIVESINARFN